MAKIFGSAVGEAESIRAMYRTRDVLVRAVQLSQGPVVCRIGEVSQGSLVASVDVPEGAPADVIQLPHAGLAVRIDLPQRTALHLTQGTTRRLHLA